MLTLEAERRTVIGKTSKILPPNLMAGVFYGRKEASTPIVLSKSAFKKVFREAGESAVINLKADGKELEALIHEVDIDPVRGEPRHADFYIIEKGKKVQVKVPISFEGTSLAVRNLGGILVKVLREIEIEAFPKDLPQNIVVDISKLETLQSQMLIKDVEFPTGVSAITDQSEVVASITEAKEEVVEEVPVDLSTIEVEKKGKKEEEGAEGEPAASAEKSSEKAEKPAGKGHEKK